MLDKISHKELLNLFAKHCSLSDEPFFIINKQLEVVYGNLAFENYVQKPMSKIISSNYGIVLNCMSINKDNKSCGETYYCEICKIRNAIKDCFNDPNLVVKNEFVRDFKLNDEVVFKHVNLMAYRVELNNSPHVVLTFLNNQPNKASL